MIQLKWHKEIPDHILEIEHIVQQDLIKIDNDLESKPSKLIFHHVFLTEDVEGPCVFVWGEKEDDEFYHCEYLSDPQWSSFDEED